MKFFSSLAIVTLVAVCAFAPTPAAAIAMPETNAARMSRGLPPKSPILKKRGSPTLYAPAAMRSNVAVCVEFLGGCSGTADTSCCDGLTCANVAFGGTSVYRCA